MSEVSLGRLTGRNSKHQSVQTYWGQQLVLSKDDAESESALVMFTVTNARAISGKSLFALVDVEMQIAGVCFAILGVQARNAGLCG